MAAKNRYKRWQITRLREAAVRDYTQAARWARKGNRTMSDVFHKSGDSCSAKADQIEKKMK